VDGDGALAVLFEAADVAPAGVLAGADAVGAAGAAGVVVAVWFDVAGAASFLSPAFGVGASLLEGCFILSE